MSHLEKLKSAQSRKDLAKLLGYKPSSMTAIIYKTPISLKYETFEIAKKSGGIRTIKAPAPRLKKLQSHLSHFLYQCLDEIEKSRNVKPISFGFRKRRSIAENASRHKRHRWVLNLDLENFFSSFNFGRVRGYFLKERAFALHPEVATTIAQIACDGEALPQGSPCSPVISELIAQILDVRLVRLAKKYGVTYSRYADDITFSTSKGTFPDALARPDTENPEIWSIGDELLGSIERSGFVVNSTKTRMQFHRSRQMVTGLVVNEKVNISSSYYRQARAMCDSLFQSGSYFKSLATKNGNGDDAEPERLSDLSPLEGILNFIYTVTQTEERRTVQDQRIYPRAIRKLYRRFLFYKYFLNLSKPLIVTEGKTDPVYLREAVKRRDEFHPVLGIKDENAFVHAVRYFNYNGVAHEVLDLSGGGSGNLRSIPLDYKRNLYPSKNDPKAIKIADMAFPVILVLDNDGGLGPVASTIKNIFGIQFSAKSTEEFYHVTDNLYVVKIPEVDGSMTSIEDLFPTVWLERELNGKRFNSADKIDTERYFSKEVFANSVIKPNANEVDFSGFDPLLRRIVAAIQHYSANTKRLGA